MKRLSALFIVFGLAFGLAAPAWSFPGILQLASRSGFWANDFPDKPIILQHFYYYNTDTFLDEDGDDVDIQDIGITASFTRAVFPWHFGESSEYQYILEFVVPAYNISGEESASGAGDNFAESGLGHPLIYTSLGWNNPDKSLHVQGALIWQFPLGDDDLMSALGFGNNHAVMPLVAAEYRMGQIKFDGSLGYWYNFEDIDSDAKQRDYLELNGVVTYTLPSKPVWFYLQADYTSYGESDDASGNGNNDDGYSFGLGPGIGWAFRPNMHIDAKYYTDISGENTLDGQSVNIRLLWVTHL